MTWEVQLPNVNGGYTETEVPAVTRVDAQNRFARKAEVTIWDPGKDKLDNYQDYEIIQLYRNGTLDWGGFVVEQNWSDSESQIFALSHDFWLKKETVVETFDGVPVFDVLEQLITNHDNLIWDPSLVEVGDNVRISQEYRGDSLNTVINDLSEASTQEEYGATNDRRFYFRRQESRPAAVDFERGRYVSTEWDDDSRREINRVTLYYDGGAKSVTVDDRTKQQEVAEQVGADSPQIEEGTVERPEITEQDVAERKAQVILSKQSPIQVGEIETWNVTDVEPGDVVQVTDPENDIDGEYVVAEINHDYAEATVTVAENTEGVNDILADLSEDVTRVDLKGANADADDRGIINIRGSGAAVEPTVAVNGTEADRVVVTNTARQKLRDGWRGQGPITVSEIGVGDDPSNLSRTNDALENELERVGVSETLPTTTSVAYDGNISETEPREIGLFDSAGGLLVRATFEDGTFSSPTATVTLAVSDDPDIDKGVLTEAGQTAVRDLIADNAPQLPEQYAYGSDDTAPDPTDTALGNEVFVQDLDNVLVGEVDTQAEWEDRTPEFDADVPLTVENGGLKAHDVTKFTEAESVLNFVGDPVSLGDVDGGLSDDEGIALAIENDFVEFEFEYPYEVPSGEGRADLYYTCTNFTGTIEVSVNGTVVADFSYTDRTVENNLSGSGTVDEAFEPGETNTMRVELTSVSNSRIVIDTMQFLDTGDRYGGWGINRAGTFDASSAAFDAPQLAPELQEVLLSVFETTRGLDEATVDSEWDGQNVGNSQFIELANDESNYQRTDNSQTASATFSSLEPQVNVRLGISRQTINSLTTPSEGDASQVVQSLDVLANVDAVTPVGIGATDTRAVIREGQVSGSDLAESGIKAADGTLLSRCVYGAVPMTGQQLISSERTRFDPPQ